MSPRVGGFGEGVKWSLGVTHVAVTWQKNVRKIGAIAESLSADRYRFMRQSDYGVRAIMFSELIFRLRGCQERPGHLTREVKFHLPPFT